MVVNVDAVSDLLDQMKLNAKSTPGKVYSYRIGHGVSLAVTFKAVERATLPELQWTFGLLRGEEVQYVTETEAIKALQGEMPKAAMSGEAVFARLARNSENVRG